MLEIIFGFVVSGLRPFGFVAELAGRWFRKQIRFQTAVGLERLGQLAGFAAELAERSSRKQIQFRIVDLERPGQLAGFAVEFVGHWFWQGLWVGKPFISPP